MPEEQQVNALEMAFARRAERAREAS